MPVVLNVAHLPAASSFFLAALQPLGYRYQYRRGNRIGLGVHDADFFLQQSSDTPNSRHSPEHIRFHAPCTAAVRECYASALYAGSRPLHPPANRINRIGDRELDVFNTFIMDHDGNNIEVTYTRDDDGASFDGSEFNGSAIRGWQRNVADNYAPTYVPSEAQSYASRRSSASKAEKSVASSRRSVAESARGSQASKRTTARSMTVPIAPPPQPPQPEGIPMPALVRQFSGPIETLLGGVDGMSGTIPKKTVVGTMLGAAAGAAFAYAMCQSEDGKTTRERWRYVKWDNEGAPQYTDHEGTGPISQAPPEALQSLPASMSRLAIEAPPPRSRASGPPMAFDRYETRSRALTRSDHDVTSRPRSSSQAPSAQTVPATHRSSSRVSRSQSVHAPSHRSSRRDDSSARRSSYREESSSRRDSHHEDSSTRRSTHVSKREESRHSRQSKSFHTIVAPAPSTGPSRRSSTHRSTVTAIRDPPRDPTRDPTIITPGGAIVDEPSDMDLDVDNESVVPSDSISCAGDKYSRRSAGRSLKSSSKAGSGQYRSNRYTGEMRSFSDRITDIERAGRRGEGPISARRVTRTVY